MDMILSENDTAVLQWSKLVPAVISYSESCSGKSGEALRKFVMII